MLPILLAVALLVFGTNLQGVILPILGHERGVGMLSVGLYSSGWSAGFVLACLMVGRLLGRLGLALTFLSLALSLRPPRRCCSSSCRTRPGSACG